jgi:hypothetical protein
MQQSDMIRASTVFHWWPDQRAKKVISRIWYKSLE